MAEKSDDEGSLLIRILSDSDIQKAIAFFSIALILAFISVTTVTETNQIGDEIGVEDPGYYKIDYPTLLELRNSTLEMKAEQENTNFSLEILASDLEILWSNNYTLAENEEKSEYLPVLEGIEPESSPTYLNFNVTEGNLTYIYTVSYSRSRYGILSLPAAFFTLVGMVFGFKGKAVILGEIKRKQMIEEDKKKKEDRKKNKEKEYSEGDEYGGEVIYEGEKSEESYKQREKGDASHINFMGLPKEDREDE